MKITISKSQWEEIGMKGGWLRTASLDTETHKNFDNKKDALAFLSDNPLMSVGWPEGRGRMEACYWNGKIKMTKADVKIASGHGRFSKDLSDILEGQVLANKGKNPQEIANIIKSDHGLINLIREEAMTDEELMEVIEGTLQLYSWMR